MLTATITKAFTVFSNSIKTSKISERPNNCKNPIEQHSAPLNPAVKYDKILFFF